MAADPVGFDPSTAQPVGFDPATAHPVEQAAPTPPAQSGSFGANLINAAERAAGGSLINAVTFIPDAAVTLANVAGGAVDKVLGINEPDIEQPSSFWQGKLNKVTKAPTSTMGKVAEGVTTAVGAGALAGLATGAKALGSAAEQAVQRGVRTAEKEVPLTRVTTQAAEKAMTAGYNLSPAYVGGETRQALQSAVGKAATHRATAASNERITDGLAKLSLGLSPSEELAPETLDKLEQEAFTDYQRARELGPLPDDDKFRDAVREAGKRFRLSNGKYTFDGIGELKTQYLDAHEMDSNQLVDDVRTLRASARANLTGASTPADRAKGYVQRQIADALEERLDRAAAAKGQPDLLKHLRASRVQLAKINTVRDALGAGGHVRASDLKRINDAQPGLLSDGLLLIAQTAKNFPKDVELISEKGGEGGWSAVDYLLGGSGILSGHPTLAIPSLARPVIKGALLSEGSQRAMLRNLSKPPSSIAQGAKGLAKGASAVGKAAVRGGAIEGYEDLGDQGP